MGRSESCSEKKNPPNQRNHKVRLSRTTFAWTQEKNLDLLRALRHLERERKRKKEKEREREIERQKRKREKKMMSENKFRTEEASEPHGRAPRQRFASQSRRCVAPSPSRRRFRRRSSRRRAALRRCSLGRGAVRLSLTHTLSHRDPEREREREREVVLRNHSDLVLVLLLCCLFSFLWCWDGHQLIIIIISIKSTLTFRTTSNFEFAFASFLWSWLRVRCFQADLSTASRNTTMSMML